VSQAGHTVAVDWSGRARGAANAIWTALVVHGTLVELSEGREREEVGNHLINLAMANPDLVVGLDFAFSLPLWFLDQEGVENGLSIPESTAERWLRDCPPPFWGHPGRSRGPEPQYRRTELSITPRPRPVFQIGGAGAVGTGSLRGFSLLRQLRREGFAVWPFDAPHLPLVVEIYPRLLTGPVVKSRASERLAYLERAGWPARAAASEHAFDAAVSALVMDAHRDHLSALWREDDLVLQREGQIWRPNGERPSPPGCPRDAQPLPVSEGWSPG
jgi:hypothetical protein